MEEITYQIEVNSQDKDLKDQVLELWAKVYPSDELLSISHELHMKQNLILHLAFHGKKLIGFKAGYRVKENQFLSWLGGVDEGFRNKGVGSTLIEKQHAWCRENKIHFIRTLSQNKSKSMMVLNLKHGFEVMGSFIESNGEVKVLFQKTLR